jgi:hypothetical protein
VLRQSSTPRQAHGADGKTRVAACSAPALAPAQHAMGLESELLKRKMICPLSPWSRSCGASETIFWAGVRTNLAKIHKVELNVRRDERVNGFELKDGPKGPPPIEIGLVRFRLFEKPGSDVAAGRWLQNPFTLGSAVPLKASSA